MLVVFFKCYGHHRDLHILAHPFPSLRSSTRNARLIWAPLILECLANIECNVIDIVERHSIVVLQGVAAYIDETREEKRMIHAIGNGTFVADGRRFDRKEMMGSKLQAGF